jgi:hypothetical protein
MKLFPRVAVGGLLWLTFSAVMFGDTLYLSQSYNVEQGGQFTGYLTSDPSQTLTMYCVDYSNDLTVPAPVTVNDLAELSDTRYGTTTSFSNPDTASDGLSATERYVLAAYLTTQFELVPSPSNAVVTLNDNIQGAIWNLLDVNGAVHSDGGEITDAVNWYNAQTPSALSAFESKIVIYSPAGLAGDNNLTLGTAGNRYTTGGPNGAQDTQEMIGLITTTPEPQTLAMLGAGLLALGLMRKRRKV